MLDADFDAVLAAAASGDERSFARLYRDAHPPLLRYLRVLVRDTAEDVASDVWLSVARTLARFQGDEHAFRGWMFTLARRRAIDSYRTAARAPVWLTDDHETLELPVLPVIDSTADWADERMSTAWAMDLISSLPREQAEVITLRVVAGLDVAQVARILGRSPGAVRVSAHRGLKALGRRLAVTGAQLERALA